MVKRGQDVLVAPVALAAAAVVVLSLELLGMCLQNHLSLYGTVFRALSIHAV